VNRLDRALAVALTATFIVGAAYILAHYYNA